MGIFILAQNEANIPRKSLPFEFNEASTVKLELHAKNMPKTQDASSFRLKAKPYIRLGASSPYRLVGLSTIPIVWEIVK